MRFRTPRRFVLAIALTALASVSARAGQVRINVASISFNNSSVTLNRGDHAVWVWTSSGHTVTSGDGNTSTPDGHFNSGDIPINSGSTFSWKSNFTGPQPYYCIPHAPPMSADLAMVASGASVSDFRITKVQFGNPGGLDFIEIANIGPAPGDLGMYRLRISGAATITLKKSANTTLAVPSGGRVVIYINQSGTTNDANIFVPTVAALPTTGSLALYVPNTVNTSLVAVDQIIDYVSWGAGGQENEPTAVSAGFWSANAAIQNVAPGHAIAFCGAQGGQYGANNWSEITVPNFGTAAADCTTPALRTSWGRIKSLYR